MSFWGSCRVVSLSALKKVKSPFTHGKVSCVVKNQITLNCSHPNPGILE